MKRKTLKYIKEREREKGNVVMKKCKEFEIEGKKIKKIIEEFPPKRVRKENGCIYGIEVLWDGNCRKISFLRFDNRHMNGLGTTPLM